MVEMPCALSHASIPSDELVLPLDLVRMSVGIEDINDILTDIEQVCACARVRARVCVKIVDCSDIQDLIERVRTCARARMIAFLCACTCALRACTCYCVSERFVDYVSPTIDFDL